MLKTMKNPSKFVLLASKQYYSSVMDKKRFWQTFKKPIVGLAPMDGYSDSAFRQVCKYVNPDLLTYTEFTSADGISHKAKALKQKLNFQHNEKPILAQIFGKNTDTFIKASQFCEEMGFDGIDLNMGCPAKKVVKSEHGVALRKNVDLACRLVEAVATATSLPVSVKTRLGWTNADDLIAFGKAVQNAGANMICIHARTYAEPYGVPAQFEPVYALKDALDIPVLGNGGICSLDDGLKKLGNLDGFLIGQASFGNPWVFSTKATQPTFAEKCDMMLFHANKLIEDKGLVVGCREIRKHLLKYLNGFYQAKQVRKQITAVESYADIKGILQQLSQTA